MLFHNASARFFAVARRVTARRGIAAKLGENQSQCAIPLPLGLIPRF
jgi:hypothetical protein